MQQSRFAASQRLPLHHASTGIVRTGVQHSHGMYLSKYTHQITEKRETEGGGTFDPRGDAESERSTHVHIHTHRFRIAFPWLQNRPGGKIQGGVEQRMRGQRCQPHVVHTDGTFVTAPPGRAAAPHGPRAVGRMERVVACMQS